MGVRAVNKKFDVMELVVVMVATTKKQRLGARTFSGGHIEPHGRLVETGRLFRSINEFYI